MRTDSNFTLDEALPPFREVSEWNRSVVGRVGDDQWSAPGLGEWNVLELVAHTSRAYTTLVDYLRPFGAIDVPSAASYFRMAVTNADAGTHAGIAERGRRDADVLRPDPAGVVAQRATAAIEAVHHAPVGAVCETPMGTLALADYLVTRIVELTVHTVDIADAIGLAGEEPPRAAAQRTVQVLAQMAAEPSPSRLLRALTGRAALPEGFNVFA